MTANYVQPTNQSPRVIIACRSIKPELEALRPDDPAIEIRYLKQNLHRTPERMPAAIQREMDIVEPYASQVILGYGLCSNGVVGVTAPRQGLIIPRIHDCISFFLGSATAYDNAFKERPGTYYLTPGWIEEKKDPIGYMESEYVPKLGRDTAEWGLKEELRHYTHIVLIDTRVRDVSPLRERAIENARFLEKNYDEIVGSNNLFKKLLFGPYDSEEFIILQSGEKVLQKLFFQ